MAQHPPGSRLFVALRRAAPATILVLGCCSDPRGVDPAPLEYRLYLGMHGAPTASQAWVRVLDCKTNSITDSFSYAGMSRILSGFVSLDGAYLATLESGRPTLVWDAENGAQIANLGRPHLAATFVTDPVVLVASRLDSTYIYSIPGFGADTVLPLRLRILTRVPRTSQVLAVTARGSPGSPQDYSLIVLLDIVSLKLVDSIIIDEYEQGFGLEIAAFDISADGRYLYAVGGTKLGTLAFVGYDIKNDRVAYRRPIASATGSCQVTPDGREVWVTDPGATDLLVRPWPGIIRIYDATSGATKDSIMTVGLHATDSTRALFVKDIRFVPGLERAYVTSGRAYQEGHGVLVIDSQTRQVLDVLFSVPPYPNGFMDIGASP